MRLDLQHSFTLAHPVLVDNGQTTRSDMVNPQTRAGQLRKRLSRIHVAILEHFFQYDPGSPSGLLWKESTAYCVKVGTVAGTINNLGYWEVVLQGHRYKCHHIVLLLHDKWPGPTDTEADHIDRNKSNNAIENLRWTSRSANCMNKEVQGKSPYRYATKYKNKWMAKWRMPNQGKYMFAGYFASDYEAHCAAIAHRNSVLGVSALPDPEVTNGK